MVKIAKDPKEDDEFSKRMEAAMKKQFDQEELIKPNVA